MRSAKTFLLIFVLLSASELAGVPAVFAGGDMSADRIDLHTRRTVLENGLTVLVSPMPSNPMVSLYAFVKTGAATEGAYAGSGLSHFMEHMLFKGTAKRGVGVISNEIQALGGYINAMTSYDYTVYTVTVPADAFTPALDILSDMLMNARFDPAEIDKEREVVYGEMRMYKDDPGRMLNELVNDTVYTTHPYGLPIIGFAELLKRVSYEDFKDYYKDRYTPNNIIFSVAGGIHAEGALEQVRGAFKDFERGQYYPRDTPREPEQISPRRVEQAYPTELTRMTMAYRGVSFYDRDMYALDVLAMILGQGESSRLHIELFQKQRLVRSISSYNYTPVDPGVFGIDCVLDEKDVEPVIAAVKAEVRRIATQGVRDDELKKAKRQVLSDYVRDFQTTGHVAFETAYEEAYLGDFTFSRKYVQYIDGVTARDIQRVASQYLIDRTLSTVILKPETEESGAAASVEQAQDQGISKVVLKNGLTLLLKEDHTLPLVNLMAAFNGGTRQETPDTNGLSELTSRVLVKGTKSRSSSQIVTSVESRGAGIGGFSGKNSFGVIYSSLSDDLDFGLDLLEDVLKNPVFPAEEMEKEKREIRTAIVARNESVTWITSQRLKELLFPDHSFRLDSLGTLESVEKIGRDDLLNFYKAYAVVPNMTLSVFGDFNKDELLPVLERKFASLAPQDVKLTAVTPSVPSGPQTSELTKDKQQAVVMVGFQVPGFPDKDFFRIRLMASVLGSPFSGRIFTKVREEFGEAYTTGGDYSPAVDTGLVYFYAQTSPESVDKVKDMLIAEIKRLREQGVSAEELDSVKAYVKGRFARGLETVSAQAFQATLDELYGRGYDWYSRFDADIDAVTPEEITAAAQQYLDLDRSAVVVTRPPAPAVSP